MNVAQFNEEYNNIYKCIAKDEEIRKLMDIKSDSDVPNKILREKYNPRVINGELLIRIYQASSMMSKNSRAFWDNYDVRVSGAIKHRKKIELIVDRIINLLSDKWINNRQVEFVQILGDEYAPQEIHERGAKFRFINYI